MIRFKAVFIHFKAILLSTCHCTGFVTMTMNLIQTQISSCSSLRYPWRVHKVRCRSLLFTSTVMSSSQYGKSSTTQRSVSHLSSKY